MHMQADSDRKKDKESAKAGGVHHYAIRPSMNDTTEGNPNTRRREKIPE